MSDATLAGAPHRAMKAAMRAQEKARWARSRRRAEISA
jgi:hypothetical protein